MNGVFGKRAKILLRNRVNRKNWGLNRYLTAEARLRENATDGQALRR